jgi:hypothetical protein
LNIYNFLNFLRASEKVNERFVANMNASAKIHLTPAKVKGTYVTRWVSNQENFTFQQVEDAWKTIQGFATKILLERDDKVLVRASATKFNHERFSLTRKVTKEVFDRQPTVYVKIYL